MAQLKDIAELAGVSTAAVSRVLSGRMGNVSIREHKKKEIFRVAQMLEYVPDRRARSMVKQKAYSLGVLCTSAVETESCYEKFAVENYFYSTLSGVENVCRKHNYNCVLSICDEDEFESSVGQRFLRDGSVDGLVLVGYTSPRVFEKLNEFKLPYVHIGSNYDRGVHVDSVSSDLLGTFRKVITIYKGLGHKKVVIVLPGGPGAQKLAVELRSDYELDNSIDVNVVLGETLDPKGEHLFEFGKRLGNDKNCATAFILSTYEWDSIVSGLLAAGKSCPDDFSVFVVTGSFAYADIDIPLPISSIVLPLHKLGMLAAKRLFRQFGMLKQEDISSLDMVSCEIRMGKTCSRII